MRGYLLSLLVPTLMIAVAQAAPPPGHPSAEQAGQMLNVPQTPAALPYAGVVKETIDSNMYTYVLVTMAKEERWLAISRTDLKPGEAIRFGDGAVMNNFFSKTLQRTFPVIHFLGGVQKESAPPQAPPPQPVAK